MDFIIFTIFTVLIPWGNYFSTSPDPSKVEELYGELIQYVYTRAAGKIDIND